jgi:hypothetical protein
MAETEKQPSKIAQFMVFKDLDVIGRKFFSGDQVTIGQSPQADLVLEGPEIEDIHAIVYFKGEQIIISDQTSLLSLLVNGKVEKTASIGPLDLIEIGPFSIQIRMLPNTACRVLPLKPEPEPDPDPLRISQPASEAACDCVQNPEPPVCEPVRCDSAPATSHLAALPPVGPPNEYRCFNLIFGGKIRPGYVIDEVKKQLTALFHTKPWQMTQLLSGKSMAIKSNVGYYTALELKAAFEKSGALCHIEPAKEPGRKESALATGFLTGDTQKKEASNEATEKDADEDEAANFLLKNKMIEFRAARTGTAQNSSVPGAKKVIEVIKCLNNSVVDVRYLDRRQKYYINLAGKRFRLAYHKGPGQYLYFFNHQLSGTIHGPDNTCRDIDTLKSQAQMDFKEEGTYHENIPESGQVKINDGCFDYFLSLVVPVPSPAIDLPRKRKIETLKHMVVSIIAHSVFIAFLGLIPWASYI